MGGGASPSDSGLPYPVRHVSSPGRKTMWVDDGGRRREPVGPVLASIGILRSPGNETFPMSPQTDT